jgi:hypothetical protein
MRPTSGKGPSTKFAVTAFSKKFASKKVL